LRQNFPIPQHFTHFPLAANFANPPTLLRSSWLGNRSRHDEPPCPHPNLPRRSPLGVRPQEFFVLTTDEHRWTQIFRGVAKLCPSRRGGNHSAWHLVGRPRVFTIWVHLCPSAVKKVHSAPENPSESASPIFRNPFNLNGGSNLIKPNQTKKIFLPLPVLDPRSSALVLPPAGHGKSRPWALNVECGILNVPRPNGLPLPNLCASVPLRLDTSAFSRDFFLPNSCLRVFESSCEMFYRGPIREFVSRFASFRPPKKPAFSFQKSAKTPAKTHIVNPRQP
jgi:hypothetical protein